MEYGYRQVINAIWFDRSCLQVKLSVEQDEEERETNRSSKVYHERRALAYAPTILSAVVLNNMCVFTKLFRVYRVNFKTSKTS